MLTRRRFLRYALAALTCLVPRPRSAAADVARSYRALPLLGTLVEITAHQLGNRHAAPFRAAFATIQRIDRRMSVFRPDSDVSRLNAAAGIGAQSLHRETLAVLSAAARVAEQSGGALDVTLGRLSAWRRQADKTEASAPLLKAVLSHSGMQALRLDRNVQSARLAHRQAQLDLGAIAKGYAVDAALAVLRHNSPTVAAMVNAGGDLCVFGRPPGAPSDARAWRIGVRHPLAPRRLLLVLLLHEGAVATSGNDLLRSGPKFGMVGAGAVLDPRSGASIPFNNVATVLASSAMEADAQATAALVLGHGEGSSYLAEVGLAGFVVRAIERKSGARLLVACTPGFQERIAWITKEAELITQR